MGLSPGKGKKKVNAQEAAAKQAIADVKVVNPLEQRITEKATRFFNWEDDASKPKNILDAPGISDTMDIYGSAENVANQEMLGSGGLALANPASGAYKSQIEELGKNQRYDTRARGLSDALQQLKGQAYGMADSSIDRDFQRKMAVAGLENQTLRDYYGRYKVQNPWYQKLWNAGNQAARSVAGVMGAMR